MSGGAIDCGATCSSSFADGDTVVLHAEPDPGSIFAGWDGDCNGTDDCSVTIDGAKHVTAEFVPLVPVSLGAVSSSFYGNPGNTIDFTPISDGPALFTRAFRALNFNPPSTAVPPLVDCSNAAMLGVDDSTTPFTDVVREQDGSCTAVAAEGNGSQAGVGDLASFDAVFSTTITVAAPGAVRFSFFSSGGWLMAVGSDFSGETPARVTGPEAGVPLTGPYRGYPTVGGYGSTAPPVSDVVLSFPAAGTYPVELDYSACCGTARTFTVQANGGGLTPTQQQLTVARAGSGSGTVSSTRAGIACGDTCAANYDEGSTVTLHAEPAAGSTFAGWTGGGCPSAVTDCTLTLDAARQVTATFSRDEGPTRQEIAPAGKPPTACTIVGTPGNDVLRGTPGPDVICGGAGNDVIVGGGGNDVLLGGDGADRISGGAGDDGIDGGAGDDVISGGPGANKLTGGAGIDQLDYSAALPGPGKRGVRVNLAAGHASGGRGANAFTDLLAPDIENVIGSAYGDVIVGSSSSNAITGGRGNDKLDGRGGNDFLDGNAGVDRLAGGPGYDRDNGGSGTDTCTTAEVRLACERR